MKIVIGKTAGFCMGVRRAVEMVLDAPNKHIRPIFTFGELIHNPQVLSLLEEKGISVIKDIPDHGTGTVLIRAHGVPLKDKTSLKKAGFNVIDATCPRVIKVQTIICKHAEKGYATIIIGDKNHPEVTGLLGYSSGKGYVVDTMEGLEQLPFFDKAVIVAQTTQNTRFFERVKTFAAEKFPHYKIYNTICDSTAKRQVEVRKLADTVDALIVVGGHNSGNTRRIAEIARQTGKPAYHIESESELNFDDLAFFRNIGITAGASTPNWVIKKVYRALELLPVKKEKVWYRIFFKIQRALLLTNIYVSIGAGCLCYACSKLQGISNDLPHILISILYIQSMHIFNNLIGTKADRYNDPNRAMFYNNNKLLLALMAFIGGGSGLLTAYTLGIVPFFILLVMSTLGLSYDLKLVPKKCGFKYNKIRDIPGSKTILIAVAWGIVTSLLPSLAEFGYVGIPAVTVFLWAVSLVFVRTAFFDILDMQGDRIVGKETIPIILGEKKSFRLIKSILFINLFILLSASMTGMVSPLGYGLAICPGFLFIVLFAHERGYMLPGTRLEFLVESGFISAGMITFIWSVLSF